MRITRKSLALVLFFSAMALQLSYGDKVTVHFHKDYPVDVETTYVSDKKEISIRLSDRSKSYENLRLEASPFLDNVTWFPQDSAWLNMTKRGSESIDYTFNLSKILAETPNNTNTDSPCALIDQTSDFLCNLQLGATFGAKLTYPIYLKIESTQEAEPTIKILGSSFNDSKGHFYPKDAEYTRKSLENQNHYMSAETEKDFNQPTRTLKLAPENIAARDILRELRPAYLRFTCPNLVKLVRFELNQPLESSTQVNLAKFGLPFDTNYTCGYTLILTELVNNASLIPIKSQSKIPIRSNSNFTEWALDFPEVSTLRYDYAKMMKDIKNLTEELKLARFDSKMDLVNLMLNLETKGNGSNATLLKSFGAVAQNMSDMKNMIIVLFIIVGILVVGLLVQCYFIMRMKQQNAVETWQTAVEITGSSPYVKA